MSDRKLLVDLVDTVILEYSYSQDAFHQNSLSKLMGDNIRSLARGAHADYVVVGIFQTGMEAYEFSQQLKPLFDAARQKKEFSDLTIEDLLKSMYEPG